MDFIITIIASVAANVICHYVCKWLDRESGN